MVAKKIKTPASNAAKAVKKSKSKTVMKPTAKEVKAQKAADAALPESKQGIIDLFAQKSGDTGSPEVQVALLTFKILRLTNHLEGNKKDNHSRRGLLKVIAKRRRILNYLTKLDEARYKELIKKLNLKK
jgi:small subunit ribosomal protein S15